MASFVDSKKRVWDVRLDRAAVKRVLRCPGVDLLRLARQDDPADLAALVSNPQRAVEILWAVVCHEALRAGITPEAFGRGIRGAEPRALVALYEALGDLATGKRREWLRAIGPRARALPPGATDAEWLAVLTES